MKQSATYADWRAQAEKELAGADFDRSLVHTTPEGLRIDPLYVETSIDPGLPGAAPFVRGSMAGYAAGPAAVAVAPAPAAEARPFAVCMRAGPESLADDLEGGADALWLDAGDDAALTAALGHGLLAIVEAGARPPEHALGWLVSHVGERRDVDVPAARPPGDRPPVVLAIDPITAAARGAIEAGSLGDALYRLSQAAMLAGGVAPAFPIARVSTVPFHDAGADAADELALVLSAGVATLRALGESPAELGPAAAASLMTLQVAVGRDTFGELCKLRALRLCWHKVMAAAGAPDAPPPPVHAVCSTRTMAQRDPWVNMLRVTTQVFAAALGGAEIITPLSFDEALGAPSPLGRRLARNTALVLREESHLGRVIDPAGGSYYLEARTDALAREAWSRFTALEREGGIVPALTSGALRERLDRAWSARAAAIAKRKEPVLGVSEFANLDEHLPAPVPPRPAPPPPPALIPHRDAESFEALRDRIERGTADGTPAATAAPTVALVTLGPPAEHRARLGFASAFFATAGLRAREVAAPAPTDIACLCGSDERYAAEAAARATELKAAGCRRVVLAGRPGAREAELRAAGVDTFIFAGCDVLATLTELVR